MLAASCQDTEFVETLDSSKAQVMFSVAMDSPAARSRATWGDDYTPSDLGDEYDNRIDLDQFIVKIEAGGKTYNVTDIIKWKEGESNEYKFVGIVKNQNGENVGKVNLSKAKISVYANMGNDANANFATMTFNQDAENIPMWGALTVENLEFAPGKRTNVDDIYLLRAMAKFQVSLGDAAIEKGYTLTKASLNKFNLTGNNMPTGYASAESTMALDMEGVLNENTTNPEGVTELTEATEDGKGWVIYLPEISNTTASELKMLLTFSNGNNEKIETEVSVKDYTTANTGLVNIVRNHWYKYVIEDIVNAQPVVKYETLDWEPINIEVGGEGFLGLSTDLVEVFSANTGTLKFHTSSPIVDVKLKDIYKHENNGTFTEGTTDGVNAYYITKFGQKIQLGQKPGFAIEDEVNVLAKEAEILAYIDENASWDANVNEGSIIINSPYINHDEYDDSHNDTPRYLEFEVTNKQGLTATFRMIQYPPVIITNVEGYFSYREDFRIGNLHLDYDASQFPTYEIGQTRPFDNGEPTHFLNSTAPFFTLAGFFPYHLHEWDPVKKRIIKNPDSYSEAHGSCPTNSNYDGFDEVTAGLMERDYMRVDAYKGSPISGVFHRTHYLWSDGTAFVGGNIGKPQNYYQNVGPVFEKDVEVDDIDPETGNVIGKKTVTKYYRRHYTGNSFNFFYAKFVDHIYESDVTEYYQDSNKNTVEVQRKKGHARINSQAPDDNWKWGTWAVQYQYSNHRMYHIRMTANSPDYVVGWPKMETVDGRTYTAEGEVNSRMVSPSFMVASQLGATNVPKNRDHYTVPLAEGMYAFARRQCEQYVEAVYEDIDNDGYTPGKDPVTHYSDWRLPTKSELMVINNYQDMSRAMDQVLTGDSYFCSSLIPGVYDNSTVLFDRRSNPQGEISNYFMRCVRDVKSGEKPLKKVYPI